jgi:ATP phosphoribosyltransferase
MLKQVGLSPINRRKVELISKTINPDVDLIFARPEDIPKLVEKGAADLGITGRDFVVESEAVVEELLDLEFCKAKIVLAAPQSLRIRGVNDVKPGSRVATKFVNIARRYFAGKKNVEVVALSGATEVMPSLGVASLIIDTIETGETLAVHGLEVIDELLESSARLIANKESIKVKKIEINDIVMAFRSVLYARGKKMIMMNVPEKALSDVVKLLPSMAGPTIAKVEAPEPTWEVYSVIDESEVYKVISLVKKVGAKDVVILPIERIIP